MTDCSDGIILLHGIGRGASSMKRLERTARTAGYQTLNLDYPSRTRDIAALATFVDRATRRWTGTFDGQIHFVTHSMGGLIARAMIRQARPSRLGRVVMLGPPNQGSELADLLHTTWPYRWIFGPAGAQLTTKRDPALVALLGPIDFDLGIIAGRSTIDPLSWAILPKPNDGKVTVARTEIEGMRDHITLRTTHSLMMNNPKVIEAAMSFVRAGRFSH